MTDTGTSRLTAILEAQRAAFLRDGPSPLARRREQLAGLRQALQDNREKLVEAISADFGHRSRQETWCLELMPLIHGIGYLHRHVGKFMRPERRKVELTFLPGSNRVIYQPLGVVGIVSPWNYPLSLALMPLATALAAGNRAMIKPSELTPATSSLMAEMLGNIFDEEHIAVVTGDSDLAKAFSKLPFDHLVFTGSTAVGKSIMAAASENLVPVTLELGGKSPAIIERGSSLTKAAHSIAWGKLANAGQTCIAPDYVLVAEDEAAAFIAAFASEAAAFYPGIATNPDYTTVISDHHFKRLTDLVDDARVKGAKILEIGADAGSRFHPRTFLPAVVTGVTDEMAVMKEEIFGPVLPVISYRSIGDAIQYVNARPRPLALYFFGPDGPARRQVLERTTSGGVVINDTLLHYAQDAVRGVVRARDEIPAALAGITQGSR